MDNLSAKKRGRRSIKFQFLIHPILLCLFLSLIAGLIFTWPLAFNFFSSIPYTLRPISGFEQVPLMPGDHLQSYYWFWLLSDNLFGHSSFLTNPYEFNGPTGPMRMFYANFPFSILFILLLPLGAIGAYNGLIILSFLFSGLAMFLLARTWAQDFWASILAGLVFTVVPYRISHIAGGQLLGYVIFLLPLCLYFIEKTFEKRNWMNGGAAGLCLVLLALMEPHACFLTTLTLGVYLPSRILLIHSFSVTSGQKKELLWPGLTGVILGGLSFSCFLWMKLSIKNGVPFLDSNLIQPILLGTLSILLLWFYLSALLTRLTTLSFAEVRHRVGKAFSLFLILGLYAFKYNRDIPHLGLILSLLSFGLFLTYLLFFWLSHRDRLLRFDLPPVVALIFGVGTGLTIAFAYLMHFKKTFILPSTAGKGRTIQEVLLFSPRMPNLFFWQDINQERFVFLGMGLLILAGLGLIPLFRKQGQNQGRLAMGGIMALGGVLLALGPTLSYFPFYQFLYQYLPFFNYPRTSGRFVMVGFIFLGLLAAMALAAFRQWLTEKGWNRLRQGLPLLIIFLVLAEYHTYQPIGLALMTSNNQIYREIQNRLPKGRVVLELPIWPGDSHQSSAYEYTVTRTRRPMVNGYAPMVARDYIQQVFWPLYPLDQGELQATQAQELKKLKVDLITFHDNSQIYTEKVSPFPPRLALKRLMNSPFLTLVDYDQDIFLFKLNSDFLKAPSDHENPTLPPLEKRDLGGFKNRAVITSPVSAVFYAHNLPQETGKFYLDPSASGYYLLMDERQLNQGRLIPRPGIGGNVTVAIPGQDQPGYLIKGAHHYFPAGKYRATFRLKAGRTSPWEEIGRLELIENRSNIINQKPLLGKDIMPAETWQDIPLEFEITQAKEIGFRIFFSGRAPLYFNLAIIGFFDQINGPGSVEAEDLLRQTGTVVSDPLASGKEAVFGKAGFHPPIYLCYGPYRTFEPGRYKIHFFMRLKGSPQADTKKEVALIEVATDMGKRIFEKRRVVVQDLSLDQYRPIDLTFNIPFRCELGYRVKFLGKADLLIDRMEVVDFQGMESER